MLFFYNAVFTAFFWCSISLYLIINGNRIKFLKNVQVVRGKQFPSIAIIIAVRNEEENIEKALESLCNLDYPNYRIVLINDRSTDRTPEILEKFARQHQQIKVIHIDELPKGWMGKNHALYKGYQNTGEDWILFTDADVSFRPDTLQKALSYSMQQPLDHLVVFPYIHSRSAIFNGVLTTFKVVFDLQYRPWAVRNKESKASVGIGAFNLVKRTSYEAAGTHRRIALHPNDDLQLGEMMKAQGFKQDVLYGDKQIEYEWYTSLSEFINGLMKNSFSSVNYSFTKAVFCSLGALLFFVLPVPVLLLSGKPELQSPAFIILLSQTALYLLKPALHARWWHIPLIPFAALIIVYIMMKSTITTIARGGIYWRESFYPLSELKKYK